MAKIGTVIDRKYKIIEYISKGGMSDVYLAYDMRLNKHWAIKEISTANSDHQYMINSLLSEAQIAKDFDHPAFPRVIDIIEENNSLYLVMDYIKGKTLGQIIKENGALPAQTVRDWGIQLADALSYLHNQRPQIIYRDMKPTNIIVKDDGKLKLIDFGTARFFNQYSNSDTLPLGTHGFAPPEQYTAQTDVRSDIFALGMTMHYMLTGVSPTDRGYQYRSANEINEAVPKSFSELIDKCTQVDPQNRYQNCESLMSDLRKLDFTKEEKSNTVKKIIIIAILAALLVGVAVALIIVLTPRNTLQGNTEGAKKPTNATQISQTDTSDATALSTDHQSTDATDKDKTQEANGDMHVSTQPAASQVDDSYEEEDSSSQEEPDSTLDVEDNESSSSNEESSAPENETTDPDDGAESSADDDVYEVSREDYPDADGSGHGYYVVTYSDGSTGTIVY